MHLCENTQQLIRLKLHPFCVGRCYTDYQREPASVVNGYESIAGQINVELKKPFGKEKLLIDQFVSNGGRAETDFMYVKDINQKVATSVFGRYGYRGSNFDRK